MLYKIGQKMD